MTKEDPRTGQASDSAASAAHIISLANNRVDSRELFHGTREVTIAHGEEIYRLRLTAQNKLILTK